MAPSGRGARLSGSVLRKIGAALFDSGGARACARSVGLPEAGSRLADNALPNVPATIGLGGVGFHTYTATAATLAATAPIAAIRNLRGNETTLRGCKTAHA